MSNTLAEFNGFTPLPDILVQELGLIPAAVYGFIWREAQGTGCCRASQENIGKALGLSRRTVLRHIKTLVGAGYIVVRTPENLTCHEYVPTGKVTVTVQGYFVQIERGET